MKTALALLMVFATASVQAHVASSGFLTVRVNGSNLAGDVELAIRDVELAVGADANHDGQITWAELRAAAPPLSLYLRQHLGFALRGQACTLQFSDLKVNERVDGAYAWIPFSARCPQPVRELEVHYTVLQDVDPSHRGLLTLTAGEQVQTGVAGGQRPVLTLEVDSPARGRAFLQYLQAGLWHIWSGIDHLLFLLSLLLPAVLRRADGRWEPVQQGRAALLSIIKVVTAFTLAHSITLSLAAFGWVHLPSRLTESAIAASIVVAALNNLFPVVTEGRARIAFAFGLLHGFGFASVLADMGLPPGARVLSLLAFNGGIECGQLAVVLAVMPVIYAIRQGRLYRRALLPWGSAAIASVALVWLVQRAFLPGG
jgi:hypothetical protein